MEPVTSDASLEIDLGPLEQDHALGVDDDLHSVLFEHVVVLAELVRELEQVGVAGAAATPDPEANRRVRSPSLHELVVHDLGGARRDG